MPSFVFMYWDGSEHRHKHASPSKGFDYARTIDITQTRLNVGKLLDFPRRKIMIFVKKETF